MRRITTYAFAAVCSVAGTGAFGAQPADPAAAFPSRPIRFVSGFTSGGPPDAIGRIVAAKLTEMLGQQGVVDNRPGAGGTTGSKIVAEATPDGHTLLVVSASYAVVPALYAKLPFDPRKDFAGITAIYTASYVVVVPSSLSVRSLPELIALAKSKPGQLNFGSAGVGSATHFAAELFKATAQVDMVHVPYKGIAEAVTDTMTGRVQFLMSAPSTSVAAVKEGKLRALATSGRQRISAYPNTPTVGEAGLPGYYWETWGGMFAPARTPRAIVDKLNRVILSMFQMPDVQSRYAALGVEVSPMTPAEFDKFADAEITRVAALARNAGIKPN
ncbi:MAG: tripartite tricarboxylate transporter substrate binding protein [Burkholderiales bacterium]|nr:tripartite tricarboxylate transporter substrate binding protein [Burkholderiales bacterium]